MKKRNLIALAAAAILLAACIPSVYPFYTDKDVIVDQRLFGTWKEKQKSATPEIWKFEASTNNSMTLTVVDAGKTNDFIAHLFKLKQEQFLDLMPEDDFLTNETSVAAVSMIPGHLVVRVAQIDPALQLSFCNFDWLQKYLEKNPNALAHRVEGDRMFLTADTRTLQDFMLQHLATNELFGPVDPADEMVRWTNEVNSASPK